MFSARTGDRKQFLAAGLALGVILGSVSYAEKQPERGTFRDGIEADEVIGKRLAGIQAEHDKALAALKAALPADDPNLKKIAMLQAEKDQILAELRTDLKNERDTINIHIKKLEEKVPQIDLLAYDRPKGKITEVGQETVYLNVGSADFAKPGLTFSVFGEGEYRPSVERKASVQVVKVTEAHRCLAQVTEITNAARRPIVKGDLLYNPGWIPGLRDHVAVAGIIDLKGDGRDCTAEFVKALEKEGVTVDIWLDLKDLALRGAGKAITYQTSFLIVGDDPAMDAELVGDRIDSRLDKKMSARQVIHDLKEDAKWHGVWIVSARRYLTLAGMKVPMPTSEIRKKD
jgi:hypothetical protein